MEKNDANSPLRPGGRRLTVLWKQFVVTTALTGVLAGCNTMRPFAQTQTEPDPQPKQRTEQILDTVPTPQPPRVIKQQDTAQKAAQEVQRHAAIRRALLQDARRHYSEMAAQGETSYSRHLDSLQTAMTQRLQAADTSMHNRVVVLDPRKFDVGVALGFSPYLTVRLMMGAQNMPANPEMAAEVTGSMASAFESRFGWILTTEPAAFPNMIGASPAACILVPASDHVTEYEIEGLTREQKLLVANGHEARHCLDNKYNFRHIDMQDVRDALNSPAPNIFFPAWREYTSIRYKKEGVADAGIAGDMMRQHGMGMEIIDKLITWRTPQKGDIVHMTVPVLEELRDRINQMGGLDAFRALSDQEADALYFEVTDKRSPTAKTFEHLMYIGLAAGNPGHEEQLDMLMGSDLDYVKAVEFLRYFEPTEEELAAAEAEPEDEPKPLTEAEREIFRQVVGYRAGQALQDKAFELGGKITPATLISAYSALQDGLSAQQAAEPGNPVPALRMSKLQQVFIHDVQNTDYVQANKDRGVDIVAVEPSLSNFRAVVLPAPGALKPPPVILIPSIAR